ncbi:MAG: response regulator [Oscillospiraceae bacterium]|jgi:CheY-like chemotaxis protein|nr:response regulator [Oscillospiraceae bacterium]
MAKIVSAYDVLISCPGDVSPFVDLLERAIGKFNNFYGRENDVILRPISWKNNAFSQFGSHPQKILDRQIVDKSDFAVAVFWARFGTATEDYGSGTEEEIERMISDKKQVFLYFLDKDVQLSKIDVQQYLNIKAFQDKYKDKGLFFNVRDENELAVTFREHLELYMDSIVHGKEYQAKGSKLILWADDCPQNNVYLRNVLENYGIKFDLALSTDSALRMIQHNKYSLIISDMGRQEGAREGYVLLERLRGSGNNIPYIIYSAGGSSIENREEAKRKGAQCSTNHANEVADTVLKLLLST